MFGTFTQISIQHKIEKTKLSHKSQFTNEKKPNRNENRYPINKINDLSKVFGILEKKRKENVYKYVYFFYFPFFIALLNNLMCILQKLKRNYQTVWQRDNNDFAHFKTYTNTTLCKTLTKIFFSQPLPAMIIQHNILYSIYCKIIHSHDFFFQLKSDFYQTHRYMV